MTSRTQTVNTESVPVQETPTEQPASRDFNTSSSRINTNKRKFPSKQNGNKRGKFNNSSSTFNNPSQSGKRSEATFERKADIAVTSVFALLPVFELHTAFLGVLSISEAFYKILQSRDRKMTTFLTQDDLTYTLLLCVYYRCAVVTNACKTNVIFGLSALKTVAENVLLPDVLAQFVESFGKLKLSNGSTIAPLFKSYNDMKRQPGFVDPMTILRRMDLEPTFEDWAINPEPVLRYEQASSRALKNAMELRTIRFSEIEGRPEFLSCYEESDRGTYNVVALDKIDQTQAQLGAACRYRVREYTGFDQGFIIHPAFGAPEIQPKMTLTSHILKALRG